MAQLSGCFQKLKMNLRAFFLFLDEQEILFFLQAHLIDQADIFKMFVLSTL